MLSTTYKAVLLSAGIAAAASLTACGGSDSTASGVVGASATSAAPDAHAAIITVTAADGCRLDHDHVAAGGVTFKVANKDATAVSEVELLSGERIIGEKENLPPGFDGSFSVDLDAGTYTVYCPGAKTEKTTLTVTGDAAAGDQDTTALLATGTKQYGEYVNTQVGYLLTSVTALDTALKGTDLAAAQNAYKAARPYYEKIEPVAESFTVGADDLDAAIDARQGDVPDAQWSGFHRIEQGLFEAHSLTGLAPYGDGLVANVTKLQGLTKDLTYKPDELANGAQELLDEVSNSKITGEEERYSHIDLLDFQGNDEGAEQAFADLQPALTKIDPALTTQISSAFDALNTLLDSYRTGGDTSGFVLYTALTDSDKRALAAAVKAVQEPLSQVSAKVAAA